MSAETSSEPRALVGLRVLPMGYLAAVDIMQPTVRTLAFQGAAVPADAEVRKDRRMGNGPAHSVMCVEGFDLIMQFKLMGKQWRGKDFRHAR